MEFMTMMTTSQQMMMQPVLHGFLAMLKLLIFLVLSVDIIGLRTIHILIQACTLYIDNYRSNPGGQQAGCDSLAQLGRLTINLFVVLIDIANSKFTYMNSPNNKRKC